MTVAVVIPTVNGRENDLERCLAAYEATAPDATLYVETGHASCGHAWISGAERAAAAGFDYLHLTADDLEPRPGWLQTAVDTVEQGYIPSPLVYNPDGTLQSAGLVGFGCYAGPYDDWGLIEGTTVPFLTHEMWERIGMIDTHYCTDLWVSAIGRKHGWETVVRTGMVFTHYNAMPGRDHARALPDTHEYLRRLQETTT